MSALTNNIDKKRLTCPVCGSTFLNLFPAGQCKKCSRLVCGHCIQHYDLETGDSTCQDCLEKMTPYGRVSQMDPEELRLLLEDPASPDSPVAARFLGNQKDCSAVGPLGRALKSDRTAVRREAAIALGKLGDQKAIPGLMTALNDAEPSVRSHAIAALAELDAQEAIPEIKKQLYGTAKQPAGYAVKALGKLMEKDACLLLKEVIAEHPSNFIRCEALGMLSKLSHEMALESAIDCLGDPKKEVMISACKILTKLNDLEAAPKLEKLVVRTSHASVRLNAKLALKSLLAANNPDTGGGPADTVK